MSERKWHGVIFDPRVNVGHLITTATFAAGLIVWGINMDKRVAIIEQRQDMHAMRIADHENDPWHQDAGIEIGRTDQRLKSIETGQVRIETKLDRLIEER